MRIGLAFLSVVLTLLGMAGLYFGVMGFKVSGVTDSAIHEIEALIGFVIASTSLGALAIVLALEHRRERP